MMRLLTFFLMFAISNLCFAELIELEDASLEIIRGKSGNAMAIEPSATAPQKADHIFANPSSIPSQSNFSSNSKPESGITMDINLRLQIDEIRWVDPDGYGANGSQGAVSIQGLSVGHLDNGRLSSAPIRGITMDADGKNGLVIGIEQIGDAHGNGLDVKIDSIQFK